MDADEFMGQMYFTVKAEVYVFCPIGGEVLVGMFWHLEGSRF